MNGILDDADINDALIESLWAEADEQSGASGSVSPEALAHVRPAHCAIRIHTRVLLLTLRSTGSTESC